MKLQTIGLIIGVVLIIAGLYFLLKLQSFSLYENIPQKAHEYALGQRIGDYETLSGRITFQACKKKQSCYDDAVELYIDTNKIMILYVNNICNQTGFKAYSNIFDLEKSVLGEKNWEVVSGECVNITQTKLIVYEKVECNTNNDCLDLQTLSQGVCENNKCSYSTIEINDSSIIPDIIKEKSKKAIYAIISAVLIITGIITIILSNKKEK